MTDRAASPFDALKPLAGRALEQALNRLVALDPDTGPAGPRAPGGGGYAGGGGGPAGGRPWAGGGGRGRGG
ncbi:MAG: hypothetical protein K0M70_07695, partial [Arenimonas sp.]|nr:hypothetical protein [Arenimonas sp.]